MKITHSFLCESETGHELREQGIGIKTLKNPIPIDTTDDSPNLR